MPWMRRAVGFGESRVTISIAPHSVRGEWGSEQLFCFAGKIQRNIGDRAVRSIPALGKADGVFRVVAGDIPLKGRRGLVLSALCFHGDDFCTVLQQKVNFSGFVRVIARFYLKLPAKLLQDIVLGQRPLELIVGFQQNGAVVDTRHVLEQPCIKQEQLELIELVKGGKGMFHLGDIVDAVEHTG